MTQFNLLSIKMTKILQMFPFLSGVKVLQTLIRLALLNT